MTDGRHRMVITQDSDGGITVNDHKDSGLVVSIISSHPAANGPRTLLIEVYPYEGNRKADFQRVMADRAGRAFVLNCFWIEDASE